MSKGLWGVRGRGAGRLVVVVVVAGVIGGGAGLAGGAVGAGAVGAGGAAGAGGGGGAAGGAGAVRAAASRVIRCGSADLRYPFMPGGPRTFGVFRLRVTRGTCRTAHRVAKAWMGAFEAKLRAGTLALPRSVDGFAFHPLPVEEAQTFRERGRRGRTTIRFDYRIPNG